MHVGRPNGHPANDSGSAIASLCNSISMAKRSFSSGFPNPLHDALRNLMTSIHGSSHGNDGMGSKPVQSRQCQHWLCRLLCPPACTKLLLKQSSCNLHTHNIPTPRPAKFPAASTKTSKSFASKTILTLERASNDLQASTKLDAQSTTSSNLIDPHVPASSSMAHIVLDQSSTACVQE